MLVERLADIEWPVLLRLEVVEVQRSSLGVPELVGEQRVDGPADNGSLDLRGGVDPDHRGRVVERVEVVSAARLVGRILAQPRPDGSLWAVEPRLGPRECEQRMRPDEDSGLGERAATGAQPSDPATNEGRLVGRDEAGGADVEHDRPVRTQTDLGAEVVPVSRVTPVEPVVERGRAGDPDPVGGNAVQLPRLCRLEVVPDQHEIGNVTEQPLVGQVVPAEHREAGADPAALGGAEPVGLRGAKLDQRGDQDDVGVELGKVGVWARYRRHAPLHRLNGAACERNSARP
jgi:hypothetical protein